MRTSSVVLRESVNVYSAIIFFSSWGSVVQISDGSGPKINSLKPRPSRTQCLTTIAEHRPSAGLARLTRVSTTLSASCKLYAQSCWTLTNDYTTNGISCRITPSNDWSAVIDTALNNCIRNKPQGQNLGIDSLLNVGCRKVSPFQCLTLVEDGDEGAHS